MDIMEASVLHHVAIVLFLLWLLTVFNRCHPFAYFISFIYLYLVHERYVMKLRKKLQYQERKRANQERVLSDSETVRWLNHAVEKIWPLCMEQIASQNILLPIIPWFLEKYKPWTAKEAVVQSMYLGRNPPMFTEMRVLHQSSGDDHLVLELGMNFCTADDMSAVLAVKLRRRLGFGMWAKMHMTGMHVEGKVLVGVRFLDKWPFLSRLRVCFAEPPYFQMTVKPIFTHGFDVTVLPGIAGWLDKLLSFAFEQTLVQPNMLVVDVEKFSSPQPENWFFVDEKEPLAYAKVEVVEASNIKPSDLNGLADPYVKGQLGPYRFKTKIQRKTLAPKWHEEFKVPICTWETQNFLIIEVHDKDHFVDDNLGDCKINVIDLRDGKRHDMWLPLQNIKMGRLHLAITVLEANTTGVDDSLHEEALRNEVVHNSFPSKTVSRASVSSVASEKSPKVRDNFEAINIEGQKGEGIWVLRPGTIVPQIWEPRKGKSRVLDGQTLRIPDDSFGSTPPASGPLNNDSSSADEIAEGKRRVNRVQRGLHKISSLFQRHHKKHDNSGSNEETLQSRYANVREVSQRAIGVQFIVDNSLSVPISGKEEKEIDPGLGGSSPDSPSKGNAKDMAKNILGKSTRGMKRVFSPKGSRKSKHKHSGVREQDNDPESDSSNDESLLSPQVHGTSASSNPISCHGIDISDKTKDISENASHEPTLKTEDQISELNVEGLEKMDHNVASSDKPTNDLGEPSEPKFTEVNSEG
uniref:C2 domain-containing protein n=2 Tax=Rhizophora mucronata TaxID=61149 RepID=A0A2P2MDQ5_RHIMU